VLERWNQWSASPDCELSPCRPPWISRRLRGFLECGSTGPATPNTPIRKAIRNLVASVVGAPYYKRMRRGSASRSSRQEAAGENSGRLRVVAVNRISYQVNDYAKTRDFYV
jgi:hypothetical protein